MLFQLALEVLTTPVKPVQVLINTSTRSYITVKVAALSI